MASRLRVVLPWAGRSRPYPVDTSTIPTRGEPLRATARYRTTSRPPHIIEVAPVQQRHDLSGKTIAILVENGFEQVELTEPRKALEEAGAHPEIVSPRKGKVKGWNHTEWGDELAVDVVLDDADPSRYDALLLPGGVLNPDKLRMNETAVRFVRAFFEEGKPVAAICHGPWTLIEAGVVEGRRMTSYPSIRTDLKNAGAEWVDEEVVVDDGLVTSRKPDDIPAFNRKMIEEFAEGRHEGRAAAASTGSGTAARR